eukprot:3155203-Alexandrium_andersonii.AAC.1
MASEFKNHPCIPLAVAVPGGLRPPGTTRKAPPARRPARFGVTIGLSTQRDAESPGRGLVGW